MSYGTLLFLGVVVAIFTGVAQAEPYPRAQLLVEAEALHSDLKSSGVLILDAREKAKFDAGHVPGARWVDHADWQKGFGDGDDIVGWSNRLGTLGLDTASKVVVYDDNMAKDAARVWWLLRYWGCEDARLLNGGWKYWQERQLPIETDAPAFQSTKPKLAPHGDRLATKNSLLSSLAGGSLQIVDARSEVEFCGIDALTNKRAGAIPGAKQLEWSDLIEVETHRFKSADELRKLFAAAGIDLARPTATHCQSGGRASVMVFGMELMGAKSVSNYYRSWSEWGNADDTPVVPGKPKSLDEKPNP